MVKLLKLVVVVVADSDIALKRKGLVILHSSPFRKRQIIGFNIDKHQDRTRFDMDMKKEH
jgi:hypothetical protein